MQSLVVTILMSIARKHSLGVNVCWSRTRAKLAAIRRSARGSGVRSALAGNLKWRCRMDPIPAYPYLITQKCDGTDNRQPRRSAGSKPKQIRAQNRARIGRALPN